VYGMCKTFLCVFSVLSVSLGVINDKSLSDILSRLKSFTVKSTCYSH